MLVKATTLLGLLLSPAEFVPLFYVFFQVLELCVRTGSNDMQSIRNQIDGVINSLNRGLAMVRALSSSEQRLSSYSYTGQLSFRDFGVLGHQPCLSMRVRTGPMAKVVVNVNSTTANVPMGTSSARVCEFFGRLTEGKPQTQKSVKRETADRIRWQDQCEPQNERAQREMTQS